MPPSAPPLTNPNVVTLMKGIAFATMQFHYDMPPGPILQDFETSLRRASSDHLLEPLVSPLLERMQRIQQDESAELVAEDLFPAFKRLVRDLEPYMLQEHEATRQFYERLRNDWGLLSEIERSKSTMRIPYHAMPAPPEMPSSIPPPEITESQFDLELEILKPWIEALPDPVGIFAIGSHGFVKILTVNAATERVSGFTRAEAVKMDFQQTVHPADRERFFQTVGMTLASGSGIVENIRVQRKDGSYMMADIRIGFRPQNQIGWYVLIDQSKRRDALARIARYEEMLRESEQALTVLEVKQGKDPVVLLNSRSLEQLLGYPPEEMARLSLRQFFAPGEEKEFRRQVRLFRLTGAINWLGARLLCADGTITTMDIRAGRSRGKGRYGAIVWLTPASLRLNREQYALQAKIIDREMKWVGGISHTLLNVITTDLYLFDASRQEGVLEGMTPAQMELLTQLVGTHHTISDHIKGLKGLEGLEANQGSEEEIDLGDLMAQQCKIMLGSGAPVVYEQKDKGPLLIRAVRGHLLRITRNLLQNASEALGEHSDPKIHVAVKSKKIDDAFLERTGARFLYPEARPGSYVRVRINDNGRGISAEMLPRIFDLYETSKAPSQLRSGEGHVGMGLKEVRDVVKAMRGFIVVRSHEGQGSTFDVYFPQLIITKSQVESQQESVSSFAPEREIVLVVDDEKMMLTVFERIFRSYGFKEILLASDAKKALEIFHERSDISFVVTDRQMPGMDGMKLIEKLREIDPHLPIVIFSGNPDSPVEGEPTIGFLQKPVAPKKWLEVMPLVAAAARNKGTKPTD